MPKPRTRTHYVAVWLNDQEKAKLDALCAATRKKQSDIFRHHLGKNPALKAVAPPPTTFDAQALKHLAQIGNNVNQIARELHRRVRQGVTPEEFETLDRALLAVIRLTMKGGDALADSIHIGLTQVLATKPPTTLENS